MVFLLVVKSTILYLEHVQSGPCKPLGCAKINPTAVQHEDQFNVRRAGIVMLMLDTRMEPAVAKSMVQGAPDTLHSEFHLSHTMLLNLLLSEVLEPEALLRSSFRQFQTERSLPALRQRIAALEVRPPPLIWEEGFQIFFKA